MLEINANVGKVTSVKTAENVSKAVTIITL